MRFSSLSRRHRSSNLPALVLTGLVVASAAGGIFTSVSASAQSDAESYTVGLIGDYNYGPIDGPMWKESERMIADINKAKPAFIIHNGDIKGGSTECTDAIVRLPKSSFERSRCPSCICSATTSGLTVTGV
jgi:hypothetical protein